MYADVGCTMVFTLHGPLRIHDMCTRVFKALPTFFPLKPPDRLPLLIGTKHPSTPGTTLPPTVALSSNFLPRISWTTMLLRQLDFRAHLNSTCYPTT